MDNQNNSLSVKQDSLVKRVYKNAHFRYVLFGLFVCLVPLLATLGVIPNSFITLFGGVIIYTVVGLGLNLLLGYSGLISLGTAGFMGLGAYVSGYLSANLELPFIVALIVGVVVAAVIGVLVGFVSLRVAGTYLGIATLCVSEILRKTYEELDWFTGGLSGLNGNYPNLFGTRLGRSGTYILLAVVMVLIMMLTHNLVNGQVGRALHAMRGSEVCAQAMGISLLKYRLMIFSVATAYAALGGVLYMHFIKFSYPPVWVLMLSLQVLAAIVIGGLRSIYGTFFGALIVFAIPDLVLKRIPVIGEIDGLSYVFSGVLIILVIMLYPAGVKGLREDFLKLIDRSKQKKQAKKNGGKEAV